MAPRPISDSVERLLVEWRAERPDLDFSPAEVVTRLQRVRSRLDHELDASFAAAGLTAPVFHVLSVLRRQGAPHRLAQRDIAERLGLTAGTVSVRVDQLVDLGFVTRSPDPADRRGTRVALTPAGVARIDSWLPTHLANEDRLLAALTDVERKALAALLRKLLVSYEVDHETSAAGEALGLAVAPAHVALELRRSVGLPDEPGLLVRAVIDDGPAARAGLRSGDVLIRAAGRELRSILDLEDTVARGRRRLQVTVVRGTERLDVAITLGSAGR